MVTTTKGRKAETHSKAREMEIELSSAQEAHFLAVCCSYIKTYNINTWPKPLYVSVDHKTVK